MPNVIEIRPAPDVQAVPPKRRRMLSPGRHPWAGHKGGFIHVARDGSLSFYAVRKVKGTRYGPVKLGHDADIAHDAYKKWWPNPLGWNPAGVAPPEGVFLDDDLVQRYARWCAAPRPGTKRKRNRDPDWIQAKVNRLGWWAGKLHGRNLRSDGTPGCVTKDTIEAILADGVDYRHRLITIRAFYTFLRTASVEYLPTAKRVLVQHDPAKDIPIPGADPAQAVKGSKVEWTNEDSDKVIEWLEAYRSGGQGGKAATPRVRAPEEKDTFTVEEAAEHLGLTPGTVRTYAQTNVLQHEGGGKVGVGGERTVIFRRKHIDRFEREREARTRERKTKDTPHRVALALIMLGGTSAHAREIARFGKTGLVTDLEPEHVRQNGAERKIVFEHKSGNEYALAVSARVAKAAEELLRLGGVKYNAIFDWTAKAVKATGVAKFTPGRFRHRGASLAVNQGVEIEDVSRGLGHVGRDGKANTKTTGIYTVKAAPPKLPTWY